MTPANISKDIKTAAIYCRVSTDDQDCERQVRDLTAFAQRCGYQVIDAHIFRETASGKKTTRQVRNLVLQLAQARKIDVILVTELTRWGRNTVDLLSTLQTLNEYGVSIVAERGVQFDLGTAQGKMIAGFMAVLAEFEANLLSERTKSGMATARARGKHIGRPKGNRTVGKHQKAVKELTSLGFSIRDIASKLKIGKETVMACQRAAI